MLSLLKRSSLTLYHEVQMVVGTMKNGQRVATFSGNEASVLLNPKVFTCCDSAILELDVGDIRLDCISTGL